MRARAFKLKIKMQMDRMHTCSFVYTKIKKKIHCIKCYILILKNHFAPLLYSLNLQVSITFTVKSKNTELLSASLVNLDCIVPD